MKKIIMFFVILCSSMSFAEVKDNVGLFSPEEVATINTTIEKLEKEKDIKIYLNTVIGEESFQIENPQKTLIITYQKIGKDIIVTELKFTEDLRMGDKAQEIDLILDSLKEKLFAKQYLDYTVNLIDEVGKDIIIEQKEEVQEEENFPENSVEVKKGFLKKIFSKNP